MDACARTSLHVLTNVRKFDPLYFCAPMLRGKMVCMQQHPHKHTSCLPATCDGKVVKQASKREENRCESCVPALTHHPTQRPKPKTPQHLS